MKICGHRTKIYVESGKYIQYSRLQSNPVDGIVTGLSFITDIQAIGNKFPSGRILVLA